MSLIARRQLVRIVCFGLALSLPMMIATEARAQLFGAARQTGQPLQRRARPGAQAPAMEQVGSLRGNERFMRENRDTADFVGSSRQATEGFIGSVQALGTGRVPPATDSLAPAIDESLRINRPLPPLAPRGMYPPRLVLDVSFVAIDEVAVETTVIDRLNRILDSTESSVEVSVVDRRAILQGTVPSAALSRRLEILVSFEPGIDDVVNLLEIQPEGDR